MSNEDEFLITVMGLQEAHNHEIKLKERGIKLILKTNPQTCTRGCKVTVEVWGEGKDKEFLGQYFTDDLLRSLDAEKINFEALNSVFDPTAGEVICQACGFKFSSAASECPDCGLCYSL
ncbi:MAG TPA: hypothetical protein VKZ84_07000 [Bacteriovoracaceae bacterium]|nr:hypothetical protein [Bacteriovoracaceae bacterium]